MLYQSAVESTAATEPRANPAAPNTEKRPGVEIEMASMTPAM